jgi:predicted GNAT family acetyltransferase
MLSIITYATAVINKVMKNMMMSKFFRKEQLINITKSLVLLFSSWEIQKERSPERNEKESRVLVTHSKKILNDYHRRYFTKLESNLRLIVIIEAMLSQWIKSHKEAKQMIQDVLNRMKAKMKENNRKRSSKDSFEKNFAY